MNEDLKESIAKKNKTTTPSAPTSPQSTRLTIGDSVKTITTETKTSISDTALTSSKTPDSLSEKFKISNSFLLISLMNFRLKIEKCENSFIYS
ncbi:unnamed protein product [Brachionus calyciflorus]|uniref:Uncharacterized protein n=1 Tax=Brachionus calyciflorus TaxID=104777 RepID=A0A814AQ36_9BILA|nr:unnamed protein product [Brachionus calyciflorus]